MIKEWLEGWMRGPKCQSCGERRGLYGFTTFECLNPECKDFGKIVSRGKGIL